MTLKILIAGKPNVGKSTLFNRLSTRKKAITYDKPGVTRDYFESLAKLGPLNFTIIDSPGIEISQKKISISSVIKEEYPFLEKEVLVLFVVDGSLPITNYDIELLKIIRQKFSKIYLIVNKSETKKNKLDYNSYYKLGIKDPIFISAKHGDGMMNLCDVLLKENISDENKDYIKEKEDIRFSLVGAPNAGKSSILNYLIGKDLVKVSEVSGTTRDSIEKSTEYKLHKIKIVDTAGIRRKSQIKDEVEKYSVTSSVDTIYMSDIVILVIDSTKKVTKQDLKIASLIIKYKKPLIIVFNKIDLLKDKESYKKNIRYFINSSINEINNVKIIFISASSGFNKDKFYDEIISTYQIGQKTISTSSLNKWLQIATNSHKIPLTSLGKKIRLKYSIQISKSPIKIKFFTNYAEEIDDSYKKYLANSLSKYFKLNSVPVELIFTKSNNPYARKD